MPSDPPFTICRRILPLITILGATYMPGSVSARPVAAAIIPRDVLTGVKLPSMPYQTEFWSQWPPFLGPEILETTAKEKLSEGNLPAAETLYHQALKLWIKTKGEASAETARCLAQLAEFYADTGRLSESERYANRVIKILRNLPQLETMELGVALNNHGYILFKLGRFASARQRFAEAINVFQSGRVPSIVMRGLTTNNLAEVYWSEGNFKSAARHYLTAFQILRKVFGDEAPQVKSCWTHYLTARSKSRRAGKNTVLPGAPSSPER